MRDLLLSLRAARDALLLRVLSVVVGVPCRRAPISVGQSALKYDAPPLRMMIFLNRSVSRNNLLTSFEIITTNAQKAKMLDMN